MLPSTLAYGTKNLMKWIDVEGELVFSVDIIHESLLTIDVHTSLIDIVLWNIGTHIYNKHFYILCKVFQNFTALFVPLLGH